MEQGGGYAQSSVKGTVVQVRRMSSGNIKSKNDIKRGEHDRVLLDAGSDGMFVLLTPKSPDLLPRIKAALVLACKCLMYVSLSPCLNSSFLCW
jgi:hypothetical protein